MGDGVAGHCGLCGKIRVRGDGVRRWAKRNEAVLGHGSIGDDEESGVTVTVGRSRDYIFEDLMTTTVLCVVIE